MDKRQYIFLGAGICLACLAIAATAWQRSLERHAAGAAQLDPHPPPPAPPADEPSDGGPQGDASPPPAEAPVSPDDAEPQAPGRQQWGPFSFEESEDGISLFGPDGELLAGCGPEADLRPVGSVGLREAVLLTEKACEDPCNPRSRLFAADRRQASVLLDAWGSIRLQDLNRDGTQELLLDHLMDGTSEVITLPYRLDGERFVAAYAAFPDGVDRQLGNLRRAAEGACEQAATDDCRGALRAVVALAIVSGADPRAEIGRLRLPAEARGYASGAVQEVRDELGGMAE